MAIRPSRYQCPNCGGGLSYTLLRPRWWAYEAFFPEVKMPLLGICAAILIMGVVLAFIHPLLAILGVLGLGGWTTFYYFSPLQCDSCGAYFLSGHFRHGRGARVPWSKEDSKALVRRTVAACAVILGVFGVIQVAASWHASTCAANCEATGLRMQGSKKVFECTCTSVRP
jgi:hypothetical protein